MTLWVVGKIMEADGVPWEFVGVYDTEAAAVSACLTDWYFVGPTTLNFTSPVETNEWPGLYLPLLKDK